MNDRRIRPGLTEHAEAAARDLLDLFNGAETGELAIALSGSVSKDSSDHLSDLDFRIYTQLPWAPSLDWDAAWQQVRARWAERGVTLDELWFRSFEEVDAVVDSWLAGEVEPDEMIWTIWGYYPLTDLSRQIAVVDEADVVDRWRSRLTTYSETVRQALIRRHSEPLQYWRTDYHYRIKALRGDVLFVSALANKLVHHLLQTLGALNRVYYPGDGNNLRFASTLSIAPVSLVERIDAIVWPDHRDLPRQREELCALIDEVDDLVSAQGKD